MYQGLLICKKRLLSPDELELKQNIFKKYKSILNKCIRQAKAIYYKQLFDSSQSMKVTWGHINTLLGKHKNNGSLPTEFSYENSIINDPQLIANHFNHYIANIG